MKFIYGDSVHRLVISFRPDYPGNQEQSLKMQLKDKASLRMFEMTAAKLKGAEKAGRIFYVEGNKDSREMLATFLGYSGYKVATACTVAEGLRRARGERFDLLILADKYLDGSGVDLCRSIRAFDPITPIVFYSSLAYESDIKAGMAAGAQDYLIKPTGIESIEQTVGVLIPPRPLELQV